MAILKLGNLADAVEVARQATQEFQSTLWWRGHAKASWQLVPKVFRGGPDYPGERNMALKFLARARTRYAHCPPDDDLPSWLNLMQHYGLPTRLLDWTESPLVAMFFVVCEHLKDDGLLWALSPVILNQRTVAHNGILIPSHEIAKRMIDDVFIDQPGARSNVVAVIPNEMDARMLLQHSMFTIHGRPEPLEALMQSKSPAPLLSWVVPSTAKTAIREHLDLVGVRRSALFPDLDSLARDIVRQDVS